MDTLHTVIKEVDGYRIEVDIEQDDLAESPREWDNLGTMVCFHSGYNLGDEPYNEYDTYQSLLLDLGGDCLKQKDGPDSWHEWARYNNMDDNIVEKLQAYVDQHYLTLPLYLYDHSGITMNTRGFSCPWDSGQVGIIYVSHEKIREEYGVKRVSKKLRERVAKYLTGEVETYDNYLTGEVYWYNARAINLDGDEIGEGSCCGFYGEDGYNPCDLDNSEMVLDAIGQMESAIDDYKQSVIDDAETERKEHLAQTKTYIKNHVPLEHRV